LSVGSHVADSYSLKVNLSFLLESLENLVGLLVVASVDEGGHVLDLVSHLLALLVHVHFQGLLLLHVLPGGWVNHFHVQSDLSVRLSLGQTRVLLGSASVLSSILLSLSVLLVLELWLLLHHHGSLHVEWVVLHAKHRGLSSELLLLPEVLPLRIGQQKLRMLVELSGVSPKGVAHHQLPIGVELVKGRVVHAQRHLHVAREVRRRHRGVEGGLALSQFLLTVGERAPFLVGAGLVLLVELALHRLVDHRVVLLLVGQVWLELVVLAVAVVALVAAAVHLLVLGEVSRLVLWVFELTHVFGELNLVGWDGVVGTSQLAVTVGEVALFSHLAGSVLLEMPASGGLVFVVNNLVEIVG
jgi:hypothetical protein